MKPTLKAIIGLAVLGASLAPASAGPANAQMVCGEHSAITEHLSAKFGEVQHGIGILNKQEIMEIFISPNDGSWTILVTHSEGPTCVVAAGESWETIPKESLRPEFPS